MEREINYIETLATLRSVILPVNGVEHIKLGTIQRTLLTLARNKYLCGDKQNPRYCIKNEYYRWSNEDSREGISNNAQVLITKFKGDIKTLEKLLARDNNVVPIPYHTIARLAITYANTANGLRKNFKGENIFYCDLAYYSFTLIAQVFEKADQGEEEEDVTMRGDTNE